MTSKGQTVLIEPGTPSRPGRSLGARGVADGPLVPSTIDDALRWTNTWAAVGAAIIDAHDPAAAFDLLPGLAVAEQARVLAGHVIVVVAVPSVTAVVQLRALEVGAAAVIKRTAIPALLADPQPQPIAPDPMALRHHGLRLTSRPHAGLTWIREQGLQRVFTGAPRRDDSIISRREAITVRQKLTALVGIDVVRNGTRHLEQRSIPSWHQIRRIIDAARGAPGPSTAS